MAPLRGNKNFVRVPTQPSHIDGQWISDENAKRLCSDAALYTVLLDDNNNVLNCGRKTRTVNKAIKRALNIRDDTCCFPGCSEKHYVAFHHVIHWGYGGETNPDNLLKLCNFHHTLLHSGRYTIELQEQTEENNNQKWLFKTATGEVIVRNPVLPPCNLNLAPRYILPKGGRRRKD